MNLTSSIAMRLWTTIGNRYRLFLANDAPSCHTNCTVLSFHASTDERRDVLKQSLLQGRRLVTKGLRKGVTDSGVHVWMNFSRVVAIEYCECRLHVDSNEAYPFFPAICSRGTFLGIVEEKAREGC